MKELIEQLRKIVYEPSKNNSNDGYVEDCYKIDAYWIQDWHSKIYTILEKFDKNYGTRLKSEFHKNCENYSITLTGGFEEHQKERELLNKIITKMETIER